MNIREIISNSAKDKSNILCELPQEVIDALEVTYESILSGETEGKADPRLCNIFAGHINVIPSEFKASCTPMLITYCYDKDDFNGRIMDSLDHAVISCSNICREIYIITTKWDSTTINRLCGYVESVRNHGVNITFLYITKKGIVSMPT